MRQAFWTRPLVFTLHIQPVFIISTVLTIYVPTSVYYWRLATHYMLPTISNHHNNIYHPLNAINSCTFSTKPTLSLPLPTFVCLIPTVINSQGIYYCTFDTIPCSATHYYIVGYITSVDWYFMMCVTHHTYHLPTTTTICWIGTKDVLMWRIVLMCWISHFDIK